MVNVPEYEMVKKRFEDIENKIEFKKDAIENMENVPPYILKLSSPINASGFLFSKGQFFELNSNYPTEIDFTTPFKFGADTTSNHFIIGSHLKFKYVNGIRTYGETEKYKGVVYGSESAKSRNDIILNTLNPLIGKELPRSMFKRSWDGSTNLEIGFCDSSGNLKGSLVGGDFWTIERAKGRIANIIPPKTCWISVPADAPNGIVFTHILVTFNIGDLITGLPSNILSITPWPKLT